MTSSGSPPAPPRAVMDNLLDVRKRATMLKTIFEGSLTPRYRAAGRELVEGMMSSVTSAMSALNTGEEGGDGGASSYAERRRNRGAAAVAAGGPHRRSSSCTRRTTMSPYLKKVTTNKLEDGHAWRKYGQKRIQDSENPRNYYRCTHMPDQGCKARKQVQVSDTNPSEYVVSYFGQHTCRDLSTVPLVIEAAIDTPADCANFICFGGAATASSSSHAVVPPRRQGAADPMVLSRIAAGCYGSSLPAASRNEEVMGSIKGKTTVGSAPDSWPSSTEGSAGGIDATGSFPSSPSSLSGLITGSFGNGMDDDDFMFSFDP